jgi:hypothetical protein
MDFNLTIEAPDRLVVRLREGQDEATVAVSPSSAGVRSLTRALDHAMAHGYGECFWPGQPGGQYWWVFRRREETLETALMWTRGGATGWEHVFRATDAADWIRDRLIAETSRLPVS